MKNLCITGEMPKRLRIKTMGLPARWDENQQRWDIMPGWQSTLEESVMSINQFQIEVRSQEWLECCGSGLWGLLHPTTVDGAGEWELLDDFEVEDEKEDEEEDEDEEKENP